jgi:HEAT repeat protein
MKTDEIKSLLEKFYAGETTLEEENTLSEYLLNNETSGFDDDRQLFAMFAEAKNNKAPDGDFIPLKEGHSKTFATKNLHMPWYFGVAAAISVLITGIAIGWMIGSRGTGDELIALRQDISEIKALSVINRLNAESASERILATFEAGNFERANRETISALINAMTLDENVNVRIAASDALFRYGNREVVRKAFIQALKIEKDPNLQIRLINMLVNLQEREALPRLKEMMDDMDNMEIVRETAAIGVAQLL